MRAMLEILIELVSGGPPYPDNDNFTVGRSRMEEQDRRIRVGVVLLIVVAFIAYKMARAKGWL